MKSFFLLGAVPLAAALPALQPALPLKAVVASSLDPDLKIGEIESSVNIKGSNPESELSVNDLGDMDQDKLLALPVGKIPDGALLEITVDKSAKEPEAEVPAPEVSETTTVSATSTVTSTSTSTRPPAQTTTPPPPPAPEPVSKPAVAAAADIAQSSSNNGSSSTAAPATDLKGSVRQLALSLHNKVRDGKPQLTWDDALYDQALKWASRCKYEHASGARLPEVAKAAENIAYWPGEAEVSVADMLYENWKMWYDEEVRWLDPNDPKKMRATRNMALVIDSAADDSKPPGTVGHAANILDPELTKFAVAIHFCPGKLPFNSSHRGWWYAVARFNG